MIKIYVYSCLLSALSIVEMKPLNMKGRVGESLTVKCDNWNVWTDIERNTKYFCNSPCTEHKHIIITAASGKKEQKNRIQIFNNKNTLYVTFIKLKKSDSKKYYCGVSRLISDPLIEVNLEVTDAEFSSSGTTSTTFGFTTSPDFISDTSTSYIIYSTATTTSTSSSTQGYGNVLYLTICVIVIITLLMVLLTLIRKMTRKKLKKEEERVDVGEIRPGNGQPAAGSTFYYSADSDGLHANDTELAAENGNNYTKDFPLNPASCSRVNLKGACAERRVPDPQCDIVYSVIQFPKKQIEPTGQSEPNQSEYNVNDSLYSLAQLPKTN